MSETKDMQVEPKKEKHPGGRPTKYNEGMPDRLKDYMESGYIRDGDVIPTKEGFALQVEVCTDTLDNWGRKYEEFFGMLRLLKAKQHKVLKNKGLTGDFNSLIAKLLLVSDHGHTERTDLTTGGEKIQPQTVDFSSLVAPPAPKKDEVK